LHNAYFRKVNYFGFWYISRDPWTHITNHSTCAILDHLEYLGANGTSCKYDCCIAYPEINWMAWNTNKDYTLEPADMLDWLNSGSFDSDSFESHWTCI